MRTNYSINLVQITHLRTSKLLNLIFLVHKWINLIISIIHNINNRRSIVSSDYKNLCNLSENITETITISHQSPIKAKIYQMGHLQNQKKNWNLI